MMQSMTVTSAAMEKLSKKREAEKSKQPQDISGKKPITTVKNATAPCMFAYKVVTNWNLLIRIALKATIILTFPKYTPVMLVQG